MEDGRHSLMSQSRYEPVDCINLAEENKKLRGSIITLTVEAWRLERLLLKLFSNLDAKDQARYTSKLRWFIKRVYLALDEAKMKIINCEGSPYDSGIPVTAINIDEFMDCDKLFINQMIEPIVVDNDGCVVHTGVVSLQKN